MNKKELVAKLKSKEVCVNILEFKKIEYGDSYAYSIVYDINGKENGIIAEDIEEAVEFIVHPVKV